MRRYGDLYCAAIKVFPKSWGKALQAAGLDPMEHKKRRGRWEKKQAEGWGRKRIDKGPSGFARGRPRGLRALLVDALKTNTTQFVAPLRVPHPAVKQQR